MGSLQELGQWRRHGILKGGSVSAETPGKGLALLDERSTVYCSVGEDCGVTEQCCPSLEEGF